MTLNKALTSLSMLLLSSSAVFAQDKPAAQQAFSPNFIIMMVLIFGILYFFMIRPEQKKQKERQLMLKNMKKGDKILTASGIIGTIGNMKDDTVMVKIAENTVVEFTKSGIVSVINEKPAEKTAEKPAEKGEKEKK